MLIDYIVCIVCIVCFDLQQQKQYCSKKDIFTLVNLLAKIENQCIINRNWWSRNKSCTRNKCCTRNKSCTRNKLQSRSDLRCTRPKIHNDFSHNVWHKIRKCIQKLQHEMWKRKKCKRLVEDNYTTIKHG